MKNEMLEFYIKDGRSDKHTRHAYPWLYDPLLRHKKETAKNILELGVHLGGSLDAFADFFPNAQVHGVDVMIPQDQPDAIATQDGTLQPPIPPFHPRVTFHLGNAYECTDHTAGRPVPTKAETFKKFDGILWDVVLDDGPHMKETQLESLEYFHTRLAPNGVLLIEDVKEYEFEWIVNQFCDAHPEVYKNLSVINRKHASRTPYRDEFILMYME